MKLFTFLLRYSRGIVLLAIFAGIISGISNTGLLALINASLHGTASVEWLFWSFLALCAVVPLSRVTSELLLVYLGQKAIYDLRMQMSRQILSVPLTHLEKIGTPRLLAILTGDIPTVANVITTVPVLCINLAIVVGCLTYLGFLSWKVLIVLIVLIVLGILSYQIPVSRAMRHFGRARESRDVLYEHFRALTEGSKELKLHYRRRQAFLGDVLHTTADEYQREFIDGQKIYSLASSWGQLLIFVLIGILLFAGPKLSTAGSDAQTLTGYALVLIYLMQPLQILINSLPNLGQAEVALRSVQEMGLDLAKHATEADLQAPPETASWQRVELRGVTHAYHREGEDRDFVLGPVDLRLEPGEVVFIAGGNGSGKTTLGKILVGLYPPEAGQILLDGQVVTGDNLEAYRQKFAVVFSDFYLFERLLGLESPRLDEQARGYLTGLQIAHKVSVEVGRLSTTKLSQGQRKRLALLTAFLEDRPIYMFDEWAADQDPYFKDVFYLEILQELKRRGKTVVAISHDDRYYHLADRVVKLDSGKITDEFKPAETVGARLHKLGA
jgi:putative ATP-binding cassette transporter